MTLDQFKTTLILMGYTPHGNFVYRNSKSKYTVTIYNASVLYKNKQAIACTKNLDEILDTVIAEENNVKVPRIHMSD